MSEPPLPIEPTGQPRNFDIVLPDAPEFSSPVYGDDPSGAADVTACQADLEALVAAVNAGPTALNVAELFAFIQDRTGQTMEELLGTTWAELIADGETATVQIEIPLCNAIVSLTLGGEINATRQCSGLEPYPPITFGQNDFDLSVVVSDTVPDEVAYGVAFPNSWTEDVYEDGRMPDIKVHLGEPEFVYLEGEFYGRGRDSALIRRIYEVGWTYDGFTPESIQEAPGELLYNYFPYYRMKGSWTCKIAHLAKVSHSTFGTPSETQHTFFTQLPLFGFRPIVAMENPQPGEWWWRNTTEPIRVGTPVLGSDFEAGISYGAAYQLYDEGTLVSSDVHELPDLSCFGNGDCFSQGRGDNYSLQIRAVGDPVEIPTLIPIGLGDPQEGTTVNITTWTDPPFHAMRFSGTFDVDFDFSEEEAWNNFVADVEAYQSFSGLYDPDLSVDYENMEITFTFDRDENAVYLPLPSCESQIVSSAFGGEVEDILRKPHVGYTMDWGGRWYDKNFGPPQTGVYTYDDYYNFWYTNYDDPPTHPGGIFGDGFDTLGFYKRTSDRYMGALSGRIARGNTEFGRFPEDNADWAFSTFVQKPLPYAAGTYTPIIEAAAETARGPCLSEEQETALESVVAALNANPTDQNKLALRMLLENLTGKSMEQLCPIWNDVITDGNERTCMIDVGGTMVTITVSGTLASTTTCAYLPSYGLNWPQNDFDLPCVVTDSSLAFVCATTTTQVHDEVYSDITCHIDDPEFVYLHGTSATSNELYSQKFNVGYFQPFFSGISVGGEKYWPYFKVKCRWSATIGSGWNSLHRVQEGGPNSGDCYEVEDGRTYYYYADYPIMGFHPVMRYEGTPPPPPSPYDGFKSTSDPLQLGTIYVDAQGEENPQQSDLPASSEEGGLVTTSSSQRDSDYSGDYTFTLPIFAYGAPNESGGSDIFEILRFHSQERSSWAEAWDEFVVTIEDYQATANSPYDPVVTLDEENMTVHVSCETDLNAMYLPLPTCGSPPVSGYPTPYTAWVVSWGSWWMEKDWDGEPMIGKRWHEFVGGLHDGQSGYVRNEGLVEPKFTACLAARIIQDYPEDNTGYFMTDYRRSVPISADQYVPTIQAATMTDVPCGEEPPPTTPNPPITPVGGGCRSYLEGPSTCNWNVPVPAAPQPEVPKPDSPDVPQPPIPHTPNFPMPRDKFPDEPDIPTNMPKIPGTVVKTNLPNIPQLPCIVPDFGNIDPCGPGAGKGDGQVPGAGGGAGGGGPGTMAPLPGGRDWMGRRGSGGTIASVKTGGQTYEARTYLFTETTCPGQDLPHVGCMAVIVQLLMDCGIAPLDIIFQVGPEWDKEFPADKCFPRGSRIFDAAMWTARFLMLTIVDEGPPTNDVYIGPPWHRPMQTVWTFDEHWDLFNMSRGMSAEEAYGWVEVYGPNVTTPVIVRIDDPFSTVDSPTLRVEVGANFSQTDAEGLGAYKASIIRRQAVGVQATVPYSSEFFLRDLMLLQAPDRGFQETYVITGKESDISAAGRFSILTGLLPASLAELDAFPTVTDEYDAVEGGFA